MAYDLRRTPGDQSSAISSRSGDLLRIDIKGMTAGLNVTEINATIFAMSVLSVSEAGVTVLD
jgi:hypothetical protein